jgi:hypothetical protein
LNGGTEKINVSSKYGEGTCFSFKILKVLDESMNTSPTTMTMQQSSSNFLTVRERSSKTLFISKPNVSKMRVKQMSFLQSNEPNIDHDSIEVTSDVIMLKKISPTVLVVDDNIFNVMVLKK